MDVGDVTHIHIYYNIQSQCDTLKESNSELKSILGLSILQRVALD